MTPFKLFSVAALLAIACVAVRADQTSAPAEATGAASRCYGAVLFETSDGMSAWVVGPFKSEQCTEKTDLAAKAIAQMKTAGPVEKTEIGPKSVLLPMLLHTWFCDRDPEFDALSPGPDGIRGRYLCAGPNSQYEHH